MEEYFDLPYIYVYDARGLIDGETYIDLSLQLNDPAEFRLRAVGGIPDVAAVAALGGAVSVKTENGFDVGRLPVISGYRALVIPELVYHPGSQIRFSIYNVARRYITFTDPSGGCYAPYLLFVGVKRYRGSIAEDLRRQYSYGRNYYLYPYVVSTTLPVLYSANIVPSTNRNTSWDFTYQMDDADFELLSLSAVPRNGTNYEIIPYDLSGRTLTSDFVPIDRLSVLTATGNLWSNLFPVIPLYYPQGSIVRITVRSLADADVAFGAFPRDTTLNLIGMKRIPC